MKKRGFVGLFIVSIIAIAAVVGVVFAFKNAGRQKDVFANSTITVDKSNITLEIELERDYTADKRFRIVETAQSSASFTITVGGLPSSANRGVELNKSSASNGIVSVVQNTPDEEVQKTGSTTFTVTGLNGGAPVNLIFTSISSGQTVSVNVTVNMVAKDMKLAPKAHFGVRQGGAALDLTSSDILSKYIFYAHPDDDERSYTPNKFPVEYRLEQSYPGVILDNGRLSVTDQATCVDQYITLQAKLPAMSDWLDVPFYVFPAASKILVESDAYQSETTADYDNIWDLIANRYERSSANFTFALDCVKSSSSDYGFEVTSADTTLVRVDPGKDYNPYERSLSKVENLGETAINIVAYPIVKVGNQEIYFNDTTDTNVQIRDTIYIRVRNEFYHDRETATYGDESYNLVPNKKTLDAFYYEGNQGGYYDVFTLNTGNGKTINDDADVEFELIVKDKNNIVSGTYTWNSGKNINGQEVYLYDILEIGYWSNAINDWLMLSSDENHYYTNYLNRFLVRFAQTGAAQVFLGDSVTLTLRVKSLYRLTVENADTEDKATCDINLEITSAIDKFEVENLTQFDDGAYGVALVYDTNKKQFSSATVDVYGMVAMTNANNETIYKYSEKWNTAKVSDNITKDKLPFSITCDPRVEFNNEYGTSGYYHMRYSISANNIDLIEYYKDYPMTIEYTNGKSYTFYIRVYPTVERLSMAVISGSKGKIYQTLTDDDNGLSTTYSYVRTVYVRKGYTYEFAVDTPGVSVGAYAVFNKICTADGDDISIEDPREFDARKLPEGLYKCIVSLHAYSDEVYAANKKDGIEVYIIVVDPVGNVIPPLSINLDGITDRYEITLKLENLDGMTITDYTYLCIDPVLPSNVNVKVDPVDGAKNKFIITAKYLTDKTFNISFKIYKRYEFPGFNLNGKLTADVPFDFEYIAGSTVDIPVVIGYERPNTIELTSGFTDKGNSLGQYLELVSTAGAVTNAEVAFVTDKTANYKDCGITYAKWQNGKFVIAPFAPITTDDDTSYLDLDIDGVATARLDTTSGKVTVTPVEGQTDLGNYALVIYTRDSLRYVGTSNGAELVLPDTYVRLTLYIGNATEINDTINELTSNNVHDANSGVRNSLGGYNWVVAGQSINGQSAALFYTPTPEGTVQPGSGPEANVYYLDDLYTVLGWEQLQANSFSLCKYYMSADGAKHRIGNEISLNKGANGRVVLNLNRNDFYPDTEAYNYMYVDGAYSYEKSTIIYYSLLGQGYSMPMRFFVVKCLDTFEVNISGIEDNPATGFVSRKNLSPDEYTNAVDTITMQRGKGFNFTSNLSSKDGWQLNNPDFDPDEARRTGDADYDGGTYRFNPYIEFTYDNTKVVFNLDALTATIRVDVKGGVNYLNIAQNSITSDGVSTATYDVTVRVDKKPWSIDLLTYNFLYDGVYYRLFEDGNSDAYVNMEGGKAKLKFTLTCLNDANPVYANFYYTYYLKIEVAVIIVAPDVDPFYDVSGARLLIRENLDNSPFLYTKTPANDSAVFNLYKQGVYNLSMAHFADTNVVEGNKSALTLATGQTDSGVIYLDDDSAGGILVVYPTPYYINVVNIDLKSIDPTTGKEGGHTERVLIGTNLTGGAIYDDVTYSIGFTQMIYNETDKCYQPYISNSNTPKMVSSWSRAEGYKWNGRYYFRTYILCDTQVTHRLSNGTRFQIKVSIQGESNAKPIVETMTLDAKYRNTFVVTPDETTEDYAVCTMTQTQYQALGTTAVYDIALPSDCRPDYASFTVDGAGTTTTTIESTYASVTIDPKAQTLSVRLKADAAAIGKTVEIRIPYRRPGDYVNPYLSVVIVPVYFEFDSLEVIGHYETRLLVSRNELGQLKYRGLFNYDISLSGNSTLTEKMNAFNESLKTSNLVSIDSETAGKITVQITYSYIGGAPVLTKNGTCRYERTFEYVGNTENIIKRTEYLAVGTASTYTFYNWDALHASKLYIDIDKDKNKKEVIDYWKKYWDYNIPNKVQERNTVPITISLENQTATNNKEAYDALIAAGKIVIDIRSAADNSIQLELTIVPVYFTFTEFKLQNNPVKPLVALTTPTVLTVEAGGIVCADENGIADDAIDTFNRELLNAQENLSNNRTVFAFSRIGNNDGILNFNFDPSTRAITRADTAEPITATSYLLITAGITYVNGIPTLDPNGNQISTYMAVRTFGSDVGDNGDSSINLPTAPNGRTRTKAQAIGTVVRYNVALAGVTYDSRLALYESRTDGNYEREANAAWKASIDVKNSVITVTLSSNTDLFDKVLTVMAYSQEGKLMYVLNIIPAYYTVEQILLAEHIDEVPVMIQTGDANWLTKLKLDFASSRSNTTFDDFNYDLSIEDFLRSLNSSGLVSRIDDAGFITLIAGVNYDGGVPRLTNLVNSATTIQNTYRYIMIDGTPEITKAQALGQEVTYNVNRKFQSIKYSTGKDAADKDIWQTFVRGSGAEWWVDRDSTNDKCIKVNLTESTNLIGKVIRLGVFANDVDDEPSYILNVIPAYFIVEDLTLAGQNNEDHDIRLYYGETPDSPRDVVFDAVFGKYSSNAFLNVLPLLSDFTNELQGTKANLIGRYFDADLMAGDLRVTVYLDYQNGKPTLVAASAADSAFVIRMDVDFTYTIYGKPAKESEYPPMPSGPRTRTEVQAIGTTASYTIDLNKNLSMDVADLNDEEHGWKITFDDNDNVVTVELSKDAVNILLEQDIVLNFYSGYDLVFELTIQPVLFEVIGIETVYPEQPANFAQVVNMVRDVEYRAVAKYNADVAGVTNAIESFNSMLNLEKLNLENGSLIEIEDDGSYLKVSCAIDYGAAGSPNRKVPTFLNIENNPLNVVESYIEYTRSGNSHAATHYQAIGTTEYYYLGAEFIDAELSEIRIYNGDDIETMVSENYLTAALVSYDSGVVALKVEIQPKTDLLNKRVTFVIKKGTTTFTLTVKPVWFVVEGFEVNNHPERHMWLIVSDKSAQKVNDLTFRVRARYTTLANTALQNLIKTQIDFFNQQLQDAWQGYLDTYTIGSEYLVVRAAIAYEDTGIARVVDLDDAKPTQVVRDVFQYAYYSDQVANIGLARPNIPRSRTVELTIGYNAVYTLDLPNLPSGFTDEMIALYEVIGEANADDDSKLEPYGSSDDEEPLWKVVPSDDGKKLYVELASNADLVNRELKVFIYNSREHVNDEPDSYDAENVAFILTIRPVWFKVTDITLTGYRNDTIYVDSLTDFMNAITDLGNDCKFVPVFEYSTDETLKTELQAKMDEFTTKFRSSSSVVKTRTREGDNYYFQVTTSVSYVPFQGTAILTNETANRIWHTFKVVVKNDSTTEDEVNNARNVREEYQGIGTVKTYCLDSGVMAGVTAIDGGQNYEIVSLNGNYVTVKLLNTATVNEPVEVKIGTGFTLQINPVYFEILGFETVQHPERPVWILSPYSTEDLEYRVITSDISNLPTDKVDEVQAKIDALNASLNNGVAPVSITLDSNQFIIFDAAVNYEKDEDNKFTGYPEIVKIEKDRRNVVESIIPFRVWSAALRPKPEHPTAMSTTSVNQIIGATKLYTLKNIKGQVYYQYLWVENAGSMITPFENSENGTTQVYEGLSVLVNTAKNTLQIQLAADTAYLSNTIRIYIPYLTSVNGKDVWYSHCIEITPLLFELTGWTITADNAAGFIQDKNYNDYLLLTKDSDEQTIIKYQARYNAAKIDDPDLQDAIEAAVKKLEGEANKEKDTQDTNYLMVDVLDGNISLLGRTLRRNVDVPDNGIIENYVGLSSYVVYENGVPKLVESSKTLVSNQILIALGNEKDWQQIVGKKELNSGAAYAVQAVGTSAVYMAEIPNAAKIFVKDIKVVKQGTTQPITIPGERSNLVTVECEVDDSDNLVAMLTVYLAPVIKLRESVVEIRIPYATDANATEANYVYSYCITPVMFIVEGFYLDEAEDNDLALTDREVPIELHVKASYSDDIAVRTMVNLALSNFEASLNNAVNNGTLQFNVINGSGGVNVRLQPYANLLWIQRISNKITALNYIESAVQIGYSNGLPKLGNVNPLTDVTVNFRIQVNTQQGESSLFPGWLNIKHDKNDDKNKFMQAIGTSRNYQIGNGLHDVIFYYEYIEIFNGGLKRGPSEYESFAYEVVNPGRQNLTLSFTLRASAKNLNDWIEVRIPYTYQWEGETCWDWYSLQIKPVLFEIRDWKLKVNDVLVDSVTLNDAAIELYFSPDIVSGPLNQSYYNYEELFYINSAIKRLETEINTYDPRISDGYTYMVINNTAEKDHQVNYTIYRDTSNNTSYLLRDTAEATTTIMQVSANITYGVTDFSKEYVEGAQAVTAYSTETGAQIIMSQISINTTSKSVADSAGDRSTVYITQENASLLTKLNSGVDYILMSDIYLYKITELKNGAWKPASFPSNATLDGNNYKIFFNSVGFDLSDKPTNIGLFTSIPNGSVVKNVQIVLEHGTVSAPITTLEVNLNSYQSGSVSIGLLAGVNNGIVTNCAVLSEWQFEMQNLTNLKNPITNTNFEEALPFNKDGYLFDDNYFYEIGLNDKGEQAIVNVYNNLGYGITKDENGNWTVAYDRYMNVSNWITPDRTNVACYDGYSAIILNEKTPMDSRSLARLYVYANNESLSVTLGGLVGSNVNMITNSRVLIDVELYGPEHRTEVGASDEVSILSSVVGGVVGTNRGTITATYFRDGSVINNANAAKDHVSLLGGFVGQNSGKIQQSYAMGRSVERSINNYVSTAGAVKTIRNSLGGFVHINSGTISDCLVNMAILKTGTEGEVGGFVYQNTALGRISNCIENNDINLQGGGTLDYYAPFVLENAGSDMRKKVVTQNLSNLIYAGNTTSVRIVDDWKPVLKRLSDSDGTSDKYSDINNYSGFSMGQARSDDDGTWGVTPNNTIWIMTDEGPMLRSANDIAVSFRKFAWNSSPYLYNPGTAKNPYLVWNKDQFNDYVYAATAQATEADKNTDTTPLTDIETSRQNNHIRLVNNVALDGIQDTYKVIYTGTLDGNGLTMSGISLSTVTNDLATMGLFGKTEYATIRNINFEINSINSTARYVGGIAGIAINTSFVDVKVTGSQVIKGANIVGGFVGLNVVTDPTVEYYNLHSSVSVTADFRNGQTDTGAKKFKSGIEYYQQTLYAKVEAFNAPYEQGFGAAGGVFGFITSNPNNYREVDKEGNVTIKSRVFKKEIVITNAAGDIVQKTEEESRNTEHDWFLKDKFGNVIDDRVVNGKGLYYTSQIVLRNVSGAIKNVSGNVAGGLIGIMDETIELRKPNLTSLTSLTGKYYLGGLVGINLGKISGSVTQNPDGTTSTYSTLNLSGWTVLSSAGSSYVFRDSPTSENAKCFWGMTVGGVAGYNDGYSINENSGVIENINVSVNVLAPSSSNLQYIIGGVVGANGNYGTVKNALNTHTNINRYLQVTSIQASNIGYYFGRIIGRSNQTTSSFTGTSNTRMDTLQINFPNYGSQSYVSPINFATTDYVYEGIENAFGINTDGTTPKVQTMTLEEYRDYLASTITSLDLVSRVEMLEPWLRSLPTTLSTAVDRNGQMVRVEEFAPDAKNELLSWIEENKIFDTWDYNHNALRNKAILNYVDYIRYSAVSAKPSKTEGEDEFTKNITTYRNIRYAMARELFTYQYQVTSSNSTISGTQNANFTWDQYEEYLLLKQYAKQFAFLTDTTSTDYTNAYRTFAAQHGEKLANMVYPYAIIGEYLPDVPDEKGSYIYKNGAWVTLKKDTETTDADYIYKDGKVNNHEFVNGKVMINSHEDYLAMLSKFTDSKRYTSKDPLQIYLNYVVENNKDITEPNAFQFGGGWTMSLGQYYYYLAHLYGQSYNYANTTYKVPENFEATGDKGYVAYVYLNDQMNNSSAEMMTVPEFIDMIAREQEIVMKNELAWINTGHIASGARISDIGAYTIPNWINDGETWDADAVIEGNDIVYSLNNQRWAALTNYLEAKTYRGLTIAKYKEIISMGGSLYELMDKAIYNRLDGADYYIFTLQCEQYNWNDKQINFIMNNYYNGDTKTYDVQYALSATTYGNVLSVSGKGGIRAVYKNRAQVVKDNNIWFNDIDSDELLDDGEPVGVWYLMAEANGEFVNGDKTVYNFYGEGRIDLSANNEKGLGAAMYIDVDGNKLFGTANNTDPNSHSSGKDILIITKVDFNPSTDNYITSPNFPDFYRNEVDKNKKPIKVYYKIVRQIMPNNNIIITNDGDEQTKNHSDYLEESIWWRDQGFSALEFDQIKAHAMTKSIPVNARVSVGETGSASRGVGYTGGYTLADDWTSTAANNGTAGFGNKKDKDPFTTAEYVEIVLGANYRNGTWYSTYADYLLFKQLYNLGTTGISSITKSKITEMLANNTPFDYPFMNDDDSKEFIKLIVDENELAEAVEYSSDRMAFLALFKAGYSTADYIKWAQSYNYNIDDKTTRYFRLNHYIYYVGNGLQDDSTFEALDFRWVLDQDIRKDIFYETVTQESRTTDLVAYRREWYNDGKPYITYRDYCEWINIYYYDDQYRSARGDFDSGTSEALEGIEGVEINDQEEENASNGWLTLDAFAVWKRMEKYENNVEYLAKLGTTTGQDPITAPIYKRQISTTVFPKIFSSGEQTVSETTGMVVDDKYVLPWAVDPMDKFMVKYYRWGTISGYTHNIAGTGVRGFAYNEYYEDFKDNPMDLYHQRDVLDRYEYNERYNIREIYRGIDVKKYTDKGLIPKDGLDDSSQYESADKIKQNAMKYIADPKYAKACDSWCGGIDVYGNVNGDNCHDTTHAAYQVRQWLDRYGYFNPTVECGTTELSRHAVLRLDECGMKDEEDDPIDQYPHGKYVQLYIPYDYFEKACKMIKSVYSKSNGYNGYHMYMKYWAHNGNPDWICNTEEYAGGISGKQIVQKTYLVTNFWNNYNGDKSPLDGSDLPAGKKANGF